MARTSGSNTVSRRKVLSGVGIAGLGALAGCTGGQPGSEPDGETSTDSGGSSTSSLRAGGSSTVYPVANTAASYWTANAPASDTEYWGPEQYGIDTDQSLADYWAGRYGFESGDSGVPFSVAVGLSHSGTGIEKLRKGQLDLGNSSAPVSAELPDATEEELAEFTDHVVGVDAQPIVVSQEIYDAGVTEITIEELRAIYRGEITNWSELGGPDSAIQAVGRAEGSGTDTAFRVNVLGGANASMDGVDLRKGENQQVKTVVANSNNAIAYMALAFVEADGGVPPIGLEIDGTTYEYGRNLADEDYPLARDLHMYSYGGTSEKEAAFLDMIISDFGQKNFVETNNYVPLTDERQEAEREKLPDPN
ncbi:substrate-binding domain-containing protein [Halarchaeum sp. CBA1220]|uniref:PstS family phosphate ABC transporter substrate-binding protein n=1 Tax=Halarchaeum sp. CBA1220 TaxID=1853682 RepID=UPI000F3A8C27|nr:substrate-binding domain-containing protein [Halarchaeum sp. CBA1220]QLC33854.1 substrate-binding domain-containing protein [Halarchaeum sp. CBA1220]